MKLPFLILMTLLLLSGCSPAPRTLPPGDLDQLNELRRTDPGTVVDTLKKHLAANPGDDKAWTILGHAAGDLDQDDEAEAAYRQALKLNPQRFEALTGMGIMCRRKGNYDEAMAYYERAIKIDPSYAQAYSSMTVIALKQSKDAAALEYARKGYELDKTDPVIAANLAVAYHYNGQFEQRDQMTEEARRLNYQNSDTLQKIYSGEMSVRD